MDQVLANHIGRETMQPSLVLGCEQPVTGYHETNFSMAYGSHISWQNDTSPVPMETYPSLAFDSLFENRGTMRNRSILDRVKQHAESLTATPQRWRQSQVGRVPDECARSRKTHRPDAQRSGQGGGTRSAPEPIAAGDGAA